MVPFSLLGPISIPPLYPYFFVSVILDFSYGYFCRRSNEKRISFTKNHGIALRAGVKKDKELFLINI